jgi:hypothetical protein
MLKYLLLIFPLIFLDKVVCLIYLSILLFYFHKNNKFFIKEKEHFNTGKPFICTTPINNVKPIIKEPFICTAPTNNNPFMNFLSSDYADDPTRPAACPDNQQINEEIDRKFNNNYNNYYYDNNDIFLNGENQLPFYTMPVTKNPNDLKKFGDWLYHVPDTCKTNQLYCGTYEDLRYKR